MDSGLARAIEAAETLIPMLIADADENPSPKYSTLEDALALVDKEMAEADAGRGKWRAYYAVWEDLTQVECDWLQALMWRGRGNFATIVDAYDYARGMTGGGAQQSYVMGKAPLVLAGYFTAGIDAARGDS